MLRRSVATLRPMLRLPPKSKVISVFALSLLGSSCSYIVDGHAFQCKRNSDCKKIGFPGHICEDELCVEAPAAPAAANPRFACRETDWPEPNSEQTVKYPIVIERLMGATPYEGIEVLACPSFDSECKRPFARSTSDKKGKVSFELPVGYRGHLLVVPPKKDPTIIPVAAFVFPPPSPDPDVPRRQTIVISQLEIVKELTKQAEVPLSLDSAHIIFTAMGCDAKPMDHIAITTSTSGKDSWRVYVGAGGQLDPNLKSTGPSGRGAFLNLPPGLTTVTGTHATEGVIFEETVYLLPGTMNSIPIVPSPVFE